MDGSTGHPFYSCRKCRNPLALSEDLISKTFKARSGQAYMFSQAMNIIVGEKHDKELITGLHTIALIYCNNCGEELGWKYIRAYDNKQRYKLGRFVIEKAKILKEY